MSNLYLVPIVSVAVNGQTMQQPKYFNTDFKGSFASIPYGFEPLCLLSLPAPSAALPAETDVYAFPSDLTKIMAGSDVQTLSAFLLANNVPSGQIAAGTPFVTALVAIAKIFLAAQFVAGSTNQTGSLFAKGVTLSSPASSVQPIASAVSVAVAAQAQPSQPAQQAQTLQTAPASQGVGNVGTGGTPASTAPFNFAGISNLATVGEFLDAASQMWAGGPISMGDF